MLPRGRDGNKRTPHAFVHRTGTARNAALVVANHQVMRTLAVLLIVLVCYAFPVPASADGLVLEPPVPGRLVRGFDDVERYAAGHRGVDLEADEGDRVRAAAQGVVRFAGPVAGQATVSIDHGNGWRTTYQPVNASVAVGHVVTAGEVIGTIALGHCSTGCLHWGLTNGVDYADPYAYLSTGRVRLVAHGTTPTPPLSLAAATSSTAGGGMPVQGRHSSDFGMRRHPITGVWKLHDGADIAAPCGTQIVTPWPGTVTRAYFHAAYGWRVFVDHGGGVVTSYNHLPGVEVKIGQRLTAGQRLGVVGTTGLSTGCHLHWMGWRNGHLIDPLTLAG